MHRRGALSFLASAPLALAACATTGAGPRGRGVALGAGPLRDFMKMRGDLREHLVIGFLTGRYFGVTDAVMTPFYGVTAATFAKYQPASDGGFRAASFEIAYFTDLESGALLETWRNPYTGEEVRVPVTTTEPSIFYVRPNLDIELARSFPGSSMQHRVLPARTVGDDVWVSEETNVSAAIPGAAKSFRYTEVVTMHSKRSDLDNPGLSRAPTDTSYLSAVSWRPWQKMGDRPGTLTGQGDGRIGTTLDLMPALWRQETQKRFPKIFAGPGAGLDAALTAVALK